MKWNSNLYDNKHDFVAEYGKGLMEYIPDDKSLKILDLGCGTGTLTAELAKKYQVVLGADNSEEMIQKAKKAYPELRFMVVNALDMTFLAEWDVVFSNAVFHWIPDHDFLLKKIRKALKPNGKLVCEFGAYGNIKIIEDAFREVMRDMGESYHTKFNFPTVDYFSAQLINNGFIIDKVYDFDRPTPLKDGERGLYNWTRQFFAVELDAFSDESKEQILNAVEDKVRDKLWNGKHWTADYRRLRAIAHI